ncbi:MAG: hypothetical protein AB1746_14535 [Candidatus Zixiibacteriota bacterium]
MRRVPFLLFLLASFLLIATMSQAAVVEKLTLSDMAKYSTRIVIGTITDVSSAWNNDHTQIYTTIVLDVAESLKGKTEQTITFTQLGGTAEGIRVSVPGFPVFTKDSDVLLFLGDSKDMPTVGLSQGKFDIYTDMNSGERMVANNVFGLETLGDTPLSELGTVNMSLNEMKQAVKSALDESSEQKK